MARPLKPLIRGGGYYPSRRLTPLVYPGGYTTADGGGEPAPIDPKITLSGSLVRFNCSEARPFINTEVNIVPQQSGSGDPSPSNVRPISGWTEVNVTRTGKNLIDDSIKHVQGSLLLIGATSTNTYPYFLKAGTYRMTVFGIGQTYGYIRERNDDTHTTVIMNSTTGTVTLPKDGNYRIWLYGNDAVSGNVTGVMLTIGSDAVTTYSPYNGNNYTIPLGSTVYGGTLTINEDGSGELTVDKAMVDLGTLSWGIDTNRPGVFYAGISTLEARKESWCSAYEFRNISVSTSYDNYISTWDSYGRGTFIRDTSKASMTTSEFKTAMSGVQLVYDLATPTTTSLTAQQINTLVGENDVWADSGDIEVTVYGTEIVEPDLNALQSLNILLGNRYINTHEADEPTDEEALDIILGGNER